MSAFNPSCRFDLQLFLQTGVNSNLLLSPTPDCRSAGADGGWKANGSYNEKEETMLVLSRKRSEQIIINGNIRVTVLEIRSGRVRLGFSAPPEISILRSELPLREEWHANDEATAGDAATAIVDLPAAGHDTTQTLLEV